MGALSANNGNENYFQGQFSSSGGANSSGSHNWDSGCNRNLQQKTQSRSCLSDVCANFRQYKTQTWQIMSMHVWKNLRNTWERWLNLTKRCMTVSTDFLRMATGFILQVVVLARMVRRRDSWEMGTLLMMLHHQMIKIPSLRVLLLTHVRVLQDEAIWAIPAAYLSNNMVKMLNYVVSLTHARWCDFQWAEIVMLYAHFFQCRSKLEQRHVQRELEA